jgi:two-component system, NtrC family, sensor kinase
MLMTDHSLSAPRWRIARKLAVGFALVLTIFASAAYFALMGFFDMHTALHEVGHDAARMREALQLASAVRDQYAHMAHTIIINDASHLPLYEDAAGRVGEVAARVARHANEGQEKSLVASIVDASQRLNRIFHEELLPAVGRGDRGAAAKRHSEILRIITQAQDEADQLSALSQKSISSFERHASTVQHTAIRWMLILLIGALVAAAAVGVALHRAIARPLASLAARAAQIGRGDLETRVEVRGDDELTQLAGQFNAMTLALKEHQTKLVQSEKLAGIGRLAAGVAHEINNPLCVIRGYVNLLRRRDPGALDADLKVIEDEVERCRQVVDDLLELTRTTSLEADDVDLRDLATETVRRVSASMEPNVPRIVVEGEGRVVGSGRRLRQVFYNLLKNAVEASGVDGAVRVHITREPGERVAVLISDSGPGIEPAKRQYVFEPFYTTKPEGTGLGLAVSRAIARAHGGDLELAPPNGSGAAFRLMLPQKSGPAAGGTA